MSNLYEYAARESLYRVTMFDADGTATFTNVSAATFDEARAKAERGKTYAETVVSGSNGTTYYTGE